MSGTLWVVGSAQGNGNILNTALSLSGEDGFLVRLSATAPQILSGEKVRTLSSSGQDAVHSVIAVNRRCRGRRAGRGRRRSMASR